MNERRVGAIAIAVILVCFSPALVMMWLLTGDGTAPTWLVQVPVDVLLTVAYGLAGWMAWDLWR